MTTNISGLPDVEERVAERVDDPELSGMLMLVSLICLALTLVLLVT